MNTEKKLQYEEPTIGIVVFEATDIITTSENGFEGDHDSLVEE